MASTPTPSPERRDVVSLVLALIHAPLFLWAAWMLPWDSTSWFSLLCTAVSVAHLTLAIVIVLQHPRGLAWAWRSVLWLSLIVLVAYGGGLLWAGVYLVSIYGSLGQGMAAAALAATANVVLFTLPMIFRAWRHAKPSRWWRRRAAPSTVVIAGLLTLTVLHSARADELVNPAIDRVALAEGLQSVTRQHANKLRGPPAVRPTFEPVLCPPIPDNSVATLIYGFDFDSASSPPNEPRPLHGRCLVLAVHNLERELAKALAHDPQFLVQKIDIVVARRRLVGPWRPPPLESLSLRPGADGICLGSACFAPWQLVARRAFGTQKPIPQVPDLRIGVDLPRLYSELSFPILRAGDVAPAFSELTAVETISLRVEADGTVTPLARLTPAVPALTRKRVDETAKRAQDYIVRSQLPNGVFRYRVTPYREPSGSTHLNLPRHAGTTFVLCELGEDTDPIETSIDQALDLLAQQRRELGPRVALVHPRDKVGHLGSTALPLIAFLTCRSRGHHRFDPLIGELAHTLLAMQRPEGRFYFKLDLETGEPLDEPDSLYAYGQAVLALVLLEGASERPATWPAESDISSAITRSMDHVAGPYWNHVAGTFFFTEENWHCLAARAALTHHRHDGYERFCRDYVRYQQRFLLDEQSRVDPEYIGGHSFGNLFAPYNTPTAGLLEATAASAAIARAREEDADRDLAAIRLALAFLVNQQWRDDSCFACPAPEQIDGAFSESMTSPLVRIDYVQHAWAGIVHAARQLEDLP